MRRVMRGRAAAVLAAAAVIIAGCSSSAPLPATGSGAPATSTAPAGASSSAPTTSASEGASLPGLSDACSAAVTTQVAIVDLFARPVDGHKLTATDVATVFDKVDHNVPSQLRDAVATLHHAASTAVGESAVDVANLLQEPAVTTAMSQLATFVKNCTPRTS